MLPVKCAIIPRQNVDNIDKTFIAQLSWIERKMASTLFANPPEASLPEAIDHFLMAESLKPDGWKENRLFLAKCHIGEY